MTKARAINEDENKLYIHEHIYNKKLNLPIEKTQNINIGKNRPLVSRNRNLIGSQVASRPFLRNFYMS